MSVKNLCPKCHSHELVVKAVGEYKVSFNLTEDGQLLPEVEPIKEPELDFNEMVCTCGATPTIDELVQGRQSSLSGKWYPIEQLVSWEQDGETMLATQEEFDAAQAPDVDSMGEEQLREYAKSKDTVIEDMQKQMAELMAQMQALMAGQAAPQAEAPKEDKKAKPKTEPKAAPKAEPKAEPVVETNIPEPVQEEELFDPTGDEEEFGGADIFGDEESPF